MRTMHGFTLAAVAAATLIGLAGCAGMPTQDKNTAIGAGVGAVGGAAVGGVIGHEVSKDNK